MSIVHLKDVTVTGIFSKGFRVTESSKSKDGREFTQRWTVWSDDLRMSEGDVVSLSGVMSAKVNDWTDKEGQLRHSVELAINFPRMAGDEKSPAPAQAESWVASPPADAGDTWNTPGSYNDETPF
jgi:single-strand DNA-binding protein